MPQKIKFGNKIYNYETFNIGKGDDYFKAEWEEAKGYRTNYNGTYYYLEIRDYNLNDEVEILDKEDKDIPLIPDDELFLMKQNGADIRGFDYLDYNFKVLKEKINQVVEELNKRQ